MTTHVLNDQFWDSTRDLLAKSNAALSELTDVIESGITGERTDFLHEQLEIRLLTLRQRVLLATDVWELASFRNDFERRWKPYAAEPASLHLLPWVGVLICPPLDLLSTTVDALAGLAGKQVAIDVSLERRLRDLKRVLEGTAKLLGDRRVDPANEADVKREVFNVLIHYFPDTVREVPIAQVSKVYKPDIGVKSLKAAVEYKFADSMQALKRSIGGVYEDIHGYHGSADWTTFYAVFYATEAFLTPAQIAAEWSLTGVPHSWKAILVTGRGNAKAKQQAASRRGRRSRRTAG